MVTWMESNAGAVRGVWDQHNRVTIMSEQMQPIQSGCDGDVLPGDSAPDRRANMDGLLCVQQRIEQDKLILVLHTSKERPSGT